MRHKRRMLASRLSLRIAGGIEVSVRAIWKALRDLIVFLIWFWLPLLFFFEELSSFSSFSMSSLITSLERPVNKLATWNSHSSYYPIWLLLIRGPKLASGVELVFLGRFKDDVASTLRKVLTPLPQSSYFFLSIYTILWISDFKNSLVYAFTTCC